MKVRGIDPGGETIIVNIYSMLHEAKSQSGTQQRIRRNWALNVKRNVKNSLKKEKGMVKINEFLSLLVPEMKK